MHDRTLIRAIRRYGPCVLLAALCSSSLLLAQETRLPRDRVVDPRLPQLERPLMYAGLPHHALGRATLRVRGDALFVGGFGKSGNDGVRIRFGAGESFLVRLPKPIMATDVQDGATLTITVRGPQGEPLGHVRGVDIGSVSRNEVDFTPVGSRTHMLRAFRGGKELVVLPGREGAFVVMPLPAGFRTSVMADGRLCIMMMWDKPTKIDIAGGPTVEADQLFIEAEGGNRLPPRHVREMELTGTLLPALHIASEQLGFSKHRIRGLGGAQLDAQTLAGGEALVVVRHGSTDGGIRAEFGAVGSALLRLASIVDASRGTDGGNIRAAVRDGSEKILGSVRALDRGQLYHHTADFAPLGTKEYTIILEHEGNVLKEVAGGPGTVSVVPGLGGTVGTTIMPDGSLCIMLMWEKPQPIKIDGAPPVMATRQFFISKGGRKLTQAAIGALELAGTGFAPIELVGIEAPVANIPPHGPR